MTTTAQAAPASTPATPAPITTTQTTLDPTSNDKRSPAGKKLIVCLDGTSNEIGRGSATNVGKTFEMLSLTLPDRQRAYYDPGVGTLPESTARGKLGRAWSVLTGLAFGAGLRENVAQAYTWLMQNYEFGDEVYVFGFSRGAYTARALVGMLDRPGLLRPGSDNLVDYAVRQYVGGKGDGVDQFADAFCWGTTHSPVTPAGTTTTVHSVPVKFLGLWDTVQATRFGFWGPRAWPGTDTVPNAATVRHAVSIDERRWAFKSSPLVGLSADRQEVWFPGVHCDVGGTFEDCRLATISLKWVLDGVVKDLILREKTSYDDALNLAGPLDELKELSAQAVHHTDGAWRLFPPHVRTIPGEAVIHDAVRCLQEADATYRPRIPATATRMPPLTWLEPAPVGEMALTTRLS